MNVKRGWGILHYSKFNYIQMSIQKYSNIFQFPQSRYISSKRWTLFVLSMPGPGSGKKSWEILCVKPVTFRAAFRKSPSLLRWKQGIALMGNKKSNALLHIWEWVCVHEWCISPFSNRVSLYLSTFNWGKEVKGLSCFFHWCHHFR